MKFILGQKIGMSQLFMENGQLIPVTLIEAGPCYVLQNKTKEKDGYDAIQIGFKKIEKEKKIKKSQKGKEYQHLREMRDRGGTGEGQSLKVGDKIDASAFKESDIIKISGISKGKGFQGAVKRWGFKERGASHGIKHERRTIGSTGSRFPQRVIKGRRMPGRMGAERITVKNLKIMKVDVENNLIVVKGAIPGRKGTLLEIRG